MATLNFFNPAALLPSPEVAVKPPPQNTGGSFLISEALKETTQLVKAKRDVDSLKAEANAYADYVQDQSPELANLLRNKSSQYRIGMDTNEERSGFLKGVISLSRLEQQDRKLELTAQKNDKFNNTGTKLNNLRGLLDIQTRREFEWNQQETLAEKQSDARRKLLSDVGRDPGPAYQKKPNPYTARVTELSNELEATIADTDSYASKSGTPPAGFGGFPQGTRTGLFGDEEAVTPVAPGTDVGQDGATVNNLPTTNGGPIDPLVGGVAPPPEGTYTLPNPTAGAAPPKAEIVPESSTPQSTENQPSAQPPVFDPSKMNQGGKSLTIDPTGVNPPVEKTPGVTKPIVPEATPAPSIPAALSPDQAKDPLYINMMAARAANEAIKENGIKDVKSSFDNLDSQKDAVKDKSQLDRLSRLRDEAEKEISEIDQSNPELKSLVRSITRRYKEAVSGVMTMTVAQLTTEKLREGDQVVVYQTVGTSDGAPGLTVNLIERQVVDNDAKTAEMRIYKVNQDRTETDVTDEVKKKTLKRIGPVVNPGSTPVPSGATPSTAPVKKLSDLKL